MVEIEVVKEMEVWETSKVTRLHCNSNTTSIEKVEETIMFTLTTLRTNYILKTKDKRGEVTVLMKDSKTAEQALKDIAKN